MLQQFLSEEYDATKPS